MLNMLLPSLDDGNPPGCHRVLLCYDGSPAARKVLQLGLRIARSSECEIHLLATSNDSESLFMVRVLYGEVAVQHQENILRGILRKGTDFLREQGVGSHGYFGFSDPLGFLTLVSAVQPGLIIAKHDVRRGLARLRRQNSIVNLMDQLPCPVLLASGQQREEPEPDSAPEKPPLLHEATHVGVLPVEPVRHSPGMTTRIWGTLAGMVRPDQAQRRLP